MFGTEAELFLFALVYQKSGSRFSVVICLFRTSPGIGFLFWGWVVGAYIGGTVAKLRCSFEYETSLERSIFMCSPFS